MAGFFEFWSIVCVNKDQSSNKNLPCNNFPQPGYTLPGCISTSERNEYAMIDVGL